MLEVFGINSDTEIFAMIEKGGWVVSTLIVLSVLCATVAFAKLFQILRVTIGQTALIDDILARLHQGNRRDLRDRLGALRHPVASPLKPILAAQHPSDHEVKTIEEEVERLSLREMDSLNSGLKFLSLVATIAPLLGLLGTVLGMIAAFQKLQEAGNKVDPSILSGGIWEALLTTAAGLLVAIPVTVILNWLQGQVTKIARTMEDTLSIAMIRLKRGQSSRLNMRFLTPPPSKPLISLTPLIDVVFILLIFFMLASSFMDWRTIEMTVATAGEKAQEQQTVPLIVQTYASGQVGLAEEKRDVASLIAQIKREHTDFATKVILLKPAEAVSLQTSIEVLEAFTIAELPRVSFFTPLATED